jgi:hypothetical protein
VRWGLPRHGHEAAILAGRGSLDANVNSYLAEHIRSVLRLENVTLAPDTPLRSLGFEACRSPGFAHRLPMSAGDAPQR